MSIRTIVVGFLACQLDGVFGNGRGGVDARAFGVHRHIDLFAQHFELLDGGRSIDVGRHEQRALAVLAQPQRQLGRHRRLAGALQTDQHDHDRRLSGRVERRRFAQQFDQLLVDDLDDRLRRREALHHLGADRSAP